MIILNGEKPSLDVLTHFGVLGMKWGQRRTATGAEIRVARRKVRNQAEELGDQAAVVRSTAKGTAQRAKAETKLQDMNVKYLKNPDRVIAVRMTRGEKAAAIILGVGTFGVAGPGSLAGIAVTSAVSRRIEKKQDEGQYDKKKK